VQLNQKEEVKYLGLHLDRRLTWHKYIFIKQKELGITLTRMYWLLGCKTKLSTNSKLLLYKAILKPIWTYRIQLWGMASASNIEILECFQSKTLRVIVDTPWYVPNMVIWRDLQIPTVKEKIQTLQFSIQCPPQCTPKWHNSKPPGAARQQVTVKTPAKRSAYQILSVTVVFVILVFKI
jgi:hypothetical protein